MTSTSGGLGAEDARQRGASCSLGTQSAGQRLASDRIRGLGCVAEREKEEYLRVEKSSVFLPSPQQGKGYQECVGCIHWGGFMTSCSLNKQCLKP